MDKDYSNKALHIVDYAMANEVLRSDSFERAPCGGWGKDRAQPSPAHSSKPTARTSPARGLSPRSTAQPSLRFQPTGQPGPNPQLIGLDRPSPDHSSQPTTQPSLQGSPTAPRSRPIPASRALTESAPPTTQQPSARLRPAPQLTAHSPSYGLGPPQTCSQPLAHNQARHKDLSPTPGHSA